MSTPTSIVAYLLLFVVVGLVFLFVNLLVGYFLRPRLPNEEKLDVYECGEPVIGSSFVQFDLRFYVVALLFIIFDVEVAFFFPWATVFGKSSELSAASAPMTAVAEGDFEAPPAELSTFATTKLRELGVNNPLSPSLSDTEARELGMSDDAGRQTTAAMQGIAQKLKWSSLVDIGVFFAVLMVGFAYVWRRGDLDWVRSTGGQNDAKAPTTLRLSA